MPFFTIPYQIHFEDTMAYGSHHYLTNFRFQCAIREALYFQSGVSGQDLWKEDLANIVFLTYEGYSRNLAPLGLGDRVALLLTVGETTRSSMQLCLRAVSADGTPVTVGYQRFLCTARDTRQPLPLPRSMTQYSGHIDEPLTGPRFEELARKGGRALDTLFPPEVRALGRAVTAARDGSARFLTASGQEALTLPGSDYEPPGPHTALLLPGQGGYDWPLLRELYLSQPELREHFQQADAVARSILGQAFLPLVLASTKDQHDRELGRFPELDQLGIFLLGVLLATLVQQRGLPAPVVLGHSVGEVAALTVAGALRIEEGLEVICRRIAALLALGLNDAGMAALSCDQAQAEAAIAALGPSSLQLAVLNHSRQTVASGRRAELLALGEHLAQQGVTATLLKSRYPYHCRMLAAAVGPFAVGIDALRAGPLRQRLFSPADGRFHRDGDAVLRQLPLHLVRRLDFQGGVRALYERGVRTFVQCGAGDSLAKIVRKALDAHSDVRCVGGPLPGEALPAALERMVGPGSAGAAPAPLATANPPPPEVAEHPLQEPIAIIGMGCVLPGAADVDQYWANVLSSRSGIDDLGRTDPHARADFLRAGGVHPDKTYSLLTGIAPPVGPDADARPQSLLAAALAQACPARDLGRVACFLGSTADGSREHDEAVLALSLGELAAQKWGDTRSRERFTAAVESALGVAGQSAAALGQHPTYTAVIKERLGADVKVVLVDTACSSSLYAAELGIRTLGAGQCDAAIVGGVYEASVSNHCLFSQFGGLSATGSRPLDASADGVVFGSGAAVLVLKRLSAAVQAGDSILGVIRAIGLSSDGKSPGVNVPQAEGQIRAMQRAYRAADIEPGTVQFIDAHATATPVGDATEFRALCKHFAGKGPIELRSVKALIGHTGWAAGVASVIEICRAFAAKVVPPQSGFSGPGPALGLSASPFVIAQQPRPWAENRDGLPRRAAVDSFGFGGTNAHLILESYSPAFHRALRDTAAPPAGARVTLAVVGAAGLFPDASGGVGPAPAEPASRPALRFDRAQLPVPRHQLILPDVLDHTDCSQRLAMLAAEQLLGALHDWPGRAQHIGVALGLEGKTSLSIQANERIFRDRIKRLLAEASGPAALTRPELRELMPGLDAGIESRSRPAGPYSLPGAMPNVAAGRVANFFGLHGPNLVIDTGADSLADSLAVAAKLLGHNDCEVVLAGGVNALTGPVAQALGARPAEIGPPRRAGEAVALFAVTTPELAAKRGMQVLATLVLEAETAGAASDYTVRSSQVDYRGASGGRELLRAIQQVTQTGAPAQVSWRHPGPSTDPGKGAVVRLTAPPGQPPVAMSPKLALEPAKESLIAGYAPTLVRAELAAGVPPLDLRGRRILFVLDDPDAGKLLADSSLRDLDYRVACPPGAALPLSIEVDTSSEAAGAPGVERLRAFCPEVLVVLGNFHPLAPASLLERAGAERLCELLLVVGRAFYDDLERGTLKLIGVGLGGVLGDGTLHPQGGLLSGFLKSLARELPRGICRILQTDAPRLHTGLGQAAGELALGSSGGVPVEACYLRGVRHEVRLVGIGSPAVKRPLLTAASVVVATGGGRGITAVLIEELLERFGCRVVLLGRTDLAQVPRRVLELSEQEFRDFEPTFLTEEAARRRGARPAELKAEYERLRAARELHGNLTRLAALPGAIEYRVLDIRDGSAVDELIKETVLAHGRIDLVVHGAGIQASKRLPRRRLRELTDTLSTKLDGLRHLYRACQRHLGPDRRVHFHLLTSALSVLGNDGQADYGAANEAMNRLAAALATATPDRAFSAIAWPGWDGIGMTRGSEYAVLGRERMLHGVTPSEGRQAFGRVIESGGPPVTVLLSRGELGYYRVELAEKPAPLAGWFLSLAGYPYLAGHQVRGRPTVPGFFEIELAVQAAQSFRPELHPVAVERCRFLRFVLLRAANPLLLRPELRVLTDTGETVRLALRLVADIVHPSGAVLQPDVPHLECEVVLSRSPALSLAGGPSPAPDGRAVPVRDPTQAPQALVFHGPPFGGLHCIQIGREGNVSRYVSQPASALAALAECRTPFLIGDAGITLASLQVDAQRLMPLCVATELGSLRWLTGCNDVAAAALGPLTITTSAARMHGSQVRADLLEVRDPGGRLLVTATGIVGTLVGMVPAQQDDSVGAAAPAIMRNTALEASPDAAD